MVAAAVVVFAAVLAAFHDACSYHVAFMSSFTTSAITFAMVYGRCMVRSTVVTV